MAATIVAELICERAQIDALFVFGRQLYALVRLEVLHLVVLVHIGSASSEHLADGCEAACD